MLSTLLISSAGFNLRGIQQVPDKLSIQVFLMGGQSGYHWAPLPPGVRLQFSA